MDRQQNQSEKVRPARFARVLCGRDARATLKFALLYIVVMTVYGYVT